MGLISRCKDCRRLGARLTALLGFPDFGLNLGPHRLAHLPGVSIPQEVFSSRCDCFWSVFASDCVSSLYIGRRATFTPDVIDIAVPTVVPELDYDNPLYRSSAFSWSSRLMVLAGRVLHEVYSPNASRTAQQRQALVPELHLKLESWHHELPSYLRAKGTDPTKAPHAHILGVSRESEEMDRYGSADRE